MADYLIVNDAIAIDLSELEFTYSRSPGPGGQNVNKVNSKATLHWAYAESPYLPAEVASRFAKLVAKRTNDAGELVLSSNRHRTQRRNRDDCLEKLRQLVLAATVVPKARKRPKKSAAAQAKRLKSKRENAERKERRRTPRWDE